MLIDNVVLLLPEAKILLSIQNCILLSSYPPNLLFVFLFEGINLLNNLIREIRFYKNY